MVSSLRRLHMGVIMMVSEFKWKCNGPEHHEHVV